MDQAKQELPEPVVVVVASRGYLHPEAARALFDIYVEDARFVVVDGGATSRALVSEGRARGRGVRRLRIARDGDSWEEYQARVTRAIILAADAVVVFADKPREHLWGLMGKAGGAGHGLQVYGAQGALWNPPLGPAHARPDNRPFYIGPNCDYCGTALVLKDADLPEKERWNDEWVCPAEECGEEYTDWPNWVAGGMIREAKAACAGLVHDDEGESEDDGDQDDDNSEPFITTVCADGTVRRETLKEIRAGWRRRDRRIAKVERELARGKVRPARKAMDELFAQGNPGQREHELDARVSRAEGDVPREVAALNATLDEMFDVTGLKRDTFRPLRARLRELGALG